jgi:hypothetical protein
MKILLLFVFILMSGLNVLCQSDTSVVPIVAYWKPGDIWGFEVTKIKRTIQDHVVVQNDSIHYIAKMEVTAQDSSTYTIDWTMANPFFETLGLPASVRKKYPDYHSAHVIYNTTATGIYIGIKNWQEIGAMLNDLIGEKIKSISADTLKQTEQIGKDLKALTTLYNTKRGIEQLVFKELMMFHFPLGKQYTIGKIYNYTEKVPVMINSQPATGNGIIVLRHFDKEKKTCELLQRMKILPDSAHTMLKSYFLQLGIRKEAIDKAISESVLSVYSNNIYDYLIDPGIPVKITVLRETVIDVLNDHVKQIDKTIIEKVP